MAKKNKSSFYQTGITTDDKPVLGGVYSFFETQGLPLDVIFICFMERGWIPDWIELYKDAHKAGMKHARILSKLEEAIADSFGKHWSDIVISRLDNKFKDNK